MGPRARARSSASEMTLYPCHILHYSPQVCRVRCAVCGLEFAVCGVRCAVCGVGCGVWGNYSDIFEPHPKLLNCGYFTSPIPSTQRLLHTEPDHVPKKGKISIFRVQAPSTWHQESRWQSYAQSLLVHPYQWLRVSWSASYVVRRGD